MFFVQLLSTRLSSTDPAKTDHQRMALPSLWACCWRFCEKVLVLRIRKKSTGASKQKPTDRPQLPRSKAPVDQHVSFPKTFSKTLVKNKWSILKNFLKKQWCRFLRRCLYGIYLESKPITWSTCYLKPVEASPQLQSKNGSYGNSLMMDTCQRALISTASPSQRQGGLLGNIPRENLLVNIHGVESSKFFVGCDYWC